MAKCRRRHTGTAAGVDISALAFRRQIHQAELVHQVLRALLREHAKIVAVDGVERVARLDALVQHCVEVVEGVAARRGGAAGGAAETERLSLIQVLGDLLHELIAARLGLVQELHASLGPVLRRRIQRARLEFIELAPVLLCQVLLVLVRQVVGSNVRARTALEHSHRARARNGLRCVAVVVAAAAAAAAAASVVVVVLLNLAVRGTVRGVAH
mmetsp:Transcript_9131/g.16630  ORF Transcript_9131/g.16630 Transcript_9131/m.16630 type:complete len:213 (+) Transcript_9131:550-1188(+)